MCVYQKVHEVGADRQTDTGGVSELERLESARDNKKARKGLWSPDQLPLTK